VPSLPSLLAKNHVVVVEPSSRPLIKIRELAREAVLSTGQTTQSQMKAHPHCVLYVLGLSLLIRLDCRATVARILLVARARHIQLSEIHVAGCIICLTLAMHETLSDKVSFSSPAFAGHPVTATRSSRLFVEYLISGRTGIRCRIVPRGINSRGGGRNDRLHLPFAESGGRSR